MDMVTVGLFLGDEGKGSVVDFLSSQLKGNVVRYSGGSQCAHNVMYGDTHHTFSQFGSGTFNNADTIISKGMLVDPLAMMYEAEELKTKGVLNPFDKMFIDEESLVITPFQLITGKFRELSRSKRHGSCGKGVGETVFDSKTNTEAVLQIKDLREDDLVYRLKILKAIKLDQIHQLKENDELLAEFESYSLEKLARLYKEFINTVNVVNNDELIKLIQGSNNVWEGSQGTLLDCNYGFKPFITKTEVVIKNAVRLVSSGQVQSYGIVRAYGARHGAGPFPTEDATLTVRDVYNLKNKWQGEYRVGWIDVPLLKYAIKANGKIDKLVITCLDQLSGFDEIKISCAYRYLGDNNQASKYFEFGENNLVTGLKVQHQDEVVAQLLTECQPVYANLPGWQEKISDTKKIKSLPKQTRSFLRHIEEQLGVPIEFVSVGPKSNQKIF